MGNLYSDWKKERGSTNGRTLSSSSSGNLYDGWKKRNTLSELSLSTLQSDYEETTKALNNVYSGWVDSETLGNTYSAVSSMRDRLDKYRSSANLDEAQVKNLNDIIGSYDSALANWENISNTYGQYRTAKSYDRAVKKSELSSKYAGSTYEQIQDALSNASDLTEKNFLETFTDYSTSKDFQKAIEGATDQAVRDRLTQKMNNNKLVNAFNDYKALEQNANFAEMSRYTPVNDTNEYGYDGNTFLYNAINNPGEYEFDYQRDEYWLQNMPDEYKAVGNYIYNTQGSKAYRNYINAITTQVKKEATDSVRQEYTDWTDQNFGTGLAGTIANAFIDVGTLPGIVGEKIGGLIDGTGNPYGINSVMHKMAGESSGAISQNIQEAVPNVGGNILSMGYDALTSGVLSRAGQLTFGPGYTLLMGTAAYSDTLIDSLEKGTDPTKAMLTAGAAGVAETFFEYVSWEKFKALKQQDATSVKKVVTNFVKQFLTEGSEELNTDIANAITDRIINGDNADLILNYNDYISRGYSPEEANKMTAIDFGKDLARSFAVGGLSGGMSAGAVSAFELGVNKRVGGNVNTERYAEAVKGLGEDSKVYQDYLALADQTDNFRNPGKTTQAELGANFRNAYSEASKNLEAASEKNMDEAVFHRETIGMLEDSQKTYTERAFDAINKRAQKDAKAVKKELSIKDGAEKANVTDVISSEDGIKLTIDGKEVDAKSVNLNANQAEIVAEATNISDEDKRQAFLKNYDGGNAELYSTRFEILFTAAQSGVSLDEAVETIGSGMSELQSTSIYDAGQKFYFSEPGRIEEAQAPVFKDMAKNFKSGTFDESGIKGVRLSTKEKLYKQYAKVWSALGVNVKLIYDTSSKSINGQYTSEDNTITINLAARYGVSYNYSTDKAFVVSTMSHELTHWMRANSTSTAYNDIKNALVKFYDSKGSISFDSFVHDQIKKYEKNHKDDEGYSPMSRDVAEEEVVARACEDMLNDAKTMDEILSSMNETEIKTFRDAIIEFFNKIRTAFESLMNSFRSESAEAKAFHDNLEELENIRKMWVKGISDALENVQAKNAEVAKIEKQAKENVITDNTVMLSEKTYENGGREFMVNFLDSQIAKGELTVEDRDQIMSQLDWAQSLSKSFSINPNYIDYAEWQKTDAIKDSFGEWITAIVSNGDYDFNIDFATVCKKRKALDKVLNELVKGGIFDDYMPSGECLTEIINEIKSNGFEVACALCFVDAKRYRVGSWANNYLEGFTEDKKYNIGYNEMVRQMAKLEGVQTKKFDFLGRDLVNLRDQGTTLDKLTLTDDSPSIKYLKGIIKSNKAGTNNYTKAKALLEKPELRKILHPNEIISSAGLDALRAQQTDLFDLVKASSGSATPKLSLSEVAYANEVAKDFNKRNKKAQDKMRDDLRKVGGYRVQSFSDYMGNMVLDYVQLISNFAGCRFASHAYTKEYFFVKLFGMTGMKINMSIVPDSVSAELKKKFAEITKDESKLDQKRFDDVREEYLYYKEHAGMEKCSENEADYYDEADGSYWKYITVDESFPLDKAFEIQKDSRYNKNCGIIWVGVSKHHILSLLRNENVPMVIPYHKSNINPTIAHLRGIAMYNDYTNVQSEKMWVDNGKGGMKQVNLSKTSSNPKNKALFNKLHREFNFYDALAEAENEWTPNSGRSVAQMAADKYLKFCDDNGIIPKFEEFRNEDNYYKLLEDFRLYDGEGNYAPQTAVTMTFPEDFSELVEQSLKETAKTSNDMREKQDALIKSTKAIAEKYKKADAKYSDKVEVSDITDAQYQELKDHFGTTNNFNVAGYMLKDGTMLDFSGKHWGDDTSKSRQVDHRDISEVLPTSHNGYDSMVNMISNGNIRLMSETGGLNLSEMPTESQKRRLQRFFDNSFKNEGQVIVDIDEKGGNTVKSLVYNERVSAERIFMDIEDYFRNGEQKVSDLMAFHTMFSEKAGDEGYVFDKNGNVVIESSLFSLKDIKTDFGDVTKLVREYMRSLVGQSVVIESDNRTVFFDATSRREYNGSKSTYLNDEEYKHAKANSAQAIKKIVEKALNPRWVTDTDEKHGQKAKRGFTYYDVTFGILNNDGTVDYYGGRLVVRMDENNKDYFYDVDLYNHTKKEASLSAARQANDWDTSDDNVTQHNNHVKNSEKVGYHAGDIGKSEPLSRMDGGRGTGHFGTGTYFVGDPEKIKGYNKRDGVEAPVHTVDFSKYNLFRPRSNDDGIDLHDFLKKVNTYYDMPEDAIKSVREYEKRLDELEQMEFDAYYDEDSDYVLDFEKAYDLASKIYGKHRVNDAIAKATNWRYGSASNGTLWDIDSNKSVTVEELTLSDAEKEEMFVQLRQNSDDYELKRQVEKYEDFLGSMYKPGWILGISEDKVREVYNEVVKELRDANISYDDSKTSDSASTRFMKKLGYEGVDVSGLSLLDNTTYGSVIYDLKGEDLARKNAIGTARFSEKVEDDRYKLIGENERLAKQNKKLAQDVKDLKELVRLSYQKTNGKVWKPTELTTAANSLLKIADSNMSNEELRKDLADLYDRMTSWFSQDMVNGEQADLDYIMAQCEDVAEKLIETSNYKPVSDRRIASEIKKSNVELGDAKDEITAELSAMISTLDAEDRLRNMAIQIYNKYWTVSKIKTATDIQTENANAKVNQINAENAARIKELNLNHTKAMNEALDNQRLADRIHYGKIINELKQDRERKISEIKEINKKRKVDAKDAAERRAEISRITDVSLTLNKWMKENNAKKHVPEALKAPIARLISAIDFSSKQLLGLNKGEKNLGVPTQKDVSLRKALEMIHSMALENQNNMTDEALENNAFSELDLPENFAEEVDKLYKSVVELSIEAGNDNGYVLQMMSLEDLKRLRLAMTAVKKAVTQINQMLSVSNAHSMDYYAQDTISESNALGQIKGGNVRERFRDFMQYGEGTPYYVFKRFGKGAEFIFHSLQLGQDQYAKEVKQIIDFTKSLYDAEDSKRWEKEVHTFTVLDENGKNIEVKLTTAQLMSLYCLGKREQAQTHLYGGGIRIADFKEGRKSVTQPKAFILTHETMDTMMAELHKDPKAVEVAKGLQNFMNTVCSDWGNEITMKRFGIKGFTEKNYFPIRSDENVLNVSAQDKQSSIYAMLNMSFTKPLTKNANNQIVIDDIFEVFANHSSSMAKYNSMALPVLDTIKWWNYKEKTDKNEDGAFTTASVRTSLESAFGKGANRYIRTFLDDVNGTKKKGRSDTIGGKLLSLYKTSAVGANLQVALLQPISYLRAVNTIDRKYLIKALGYVKDIKALQTSCGERCGMAIWKDLGFFETDVSRGVTELIKNNATTKDKLVEASMKMASKMDSITWGFLWKACQLEAIEKDHMPYGTEAFWQTVEEKMRKTIYATQVVDSTLTRSQFMRGSDMYTKLATAFLSEPTLSINVLMDAYSDFSKDQRKTGNFQEAFHRNGKKIAIAAESYVLCATVESILRGVITTARNGGGDEDETMLDNIVASFKEQINPIGMIPIAKDILSMAQGYSASRMDEEVFQQGVYAYKAIMKSIETGEVSYKTVYTSMRAISMATGIPISAMSKELVTIWNNTIGRQYPDLILK